MKKEQLERAKELIAELDAIINESYQTAEDNGGGGQHPNPDKP